MENRNQQDIEDFGFILIRHVNSYESNMYWLEAYTSIRKIYPNVLIYIIDDNSKEEYLTEIPALHRCSIIKTDYPGRGEILGYYYFYHLHPFRKAIIIHDSMYVNRAISINNVQDISFLWSFQNSKMEDYNEVIHLLRQLKYKDELISLYNTQSRWFGCFGISSIITHEYLSTIVNKYNFLTLVHHITARPYRCALERVFAIIQFHHNENFGGENKVLFGDISQYMREYISPFGFRFGDYKKKKKILENTNAMII
jgi:hypothetical protein